MYAVWTDVIFNVESVAIFFVFLRNLSAYLHFLGKCFVSFASGYNKQSHTTKFRKHALCKGI